MKQLDLCRHETFAAGSRLSYDTRSILISWQSENMPWFVVSYNIAPDTVHSDDRFEGGALRWGWDKYAKIGETFKRLPRRTLIGEFQNFSAATSNFIEVRNRASASDHLNLENIVLAEISDFSVLS